MRDLVDSTDIRHDQQALRERMASDGYVFIRGLVDPRVLREVRVDILSELQSLDWLQPGSPLEDAQPGASPVFEGDPDWWPAYERIQKLESFHRLAHHPEVTGFFSTFFGEPTIVHPEKIARVIFPQNAGATTPPHQDYPNVGGTVDVFTAWIPLADTPRSEGGLRILPNTHDKGVRTVTVDRTRRGAPSMYLAGVSLDDPRWATAEYRAGDVIFFHSLTVHAGLPNVSNRLRVSVDFRYQPSSEPVSHIALQPHFFRDGLDRIPSWDTFAAGWSSRAWHEVPEQTAVVEATLPLIMGKIGPHAGAREGRSPFVDTTAFALQAKEQGSLTVVVP